MQGLTLTLRSALRRIAAQPGAAAVVVATIALGVGANTALFSAVNAVLLRPLPYPDPDRLVMIWEKRPTEGVFDNVVSRADFVDWEARQQSFEAIAAQTLAPVDLTGVGEPVRLQAGLVSPSFFDVLGVRMALGRTFRPEEAVEGRHHVAILSEALWRDRFGADPAMVGRSILLDAVPHEVVGVLPAGFEFPNHALELWLPLALHGTRTALSRTIHELEIYGRLKPGVSLQDARAALNVIGAALEAEYPEANRGHAPHAVRLEDQLHAPVRQGLLALVAAVAIVLLIACVNVVNLRLAAAAIRRSEMAVRAAIGASRARLVGESLVESLLLAAAGGTAGLLVAGWGIRLLRQVAPSRLPIVGADRLTIDGTVLAFTAGLSIATGLIVGLLPAWQFARHNVIDTLRHAGRTPTIGRRHLRSSLVIAEIALASLLLVGAGLTLRSFEALLGADAGFQREGRLSAFISLPAARYPTDAARLAAYDRIEARLAALPGVRAVGATSHLPVSGEDSRLIIAIEGRAPTPDTPTRAHPRAVTPDYFRALGIHLLEGRGFTTADHSDAPFVAVVNATMARRFWPGTSPVGQRVRLGAGRAWREIVGVVADVRHWGFDRPANPEIYVPQKQMVWDGLTFILAADTDPAALAPAVRSALGEIDRDLPLSNVQTLDAVAARSVETRHAALLLLGVFSGLALVLAAAGIYAVMAQAVAQRTPEIAVRMALGARPKAVLRLILSAALAQTTIGLAIGLTAGVIVMRLFDAALFGVRPADPITLAGVSLLLASTALAASLVPSLRAMRTDPTATLRS